MSIYLGGNILRVPYHQSGPDKFRINGMMLEIVTMGRGRPIDRSDEKNALSVFD